MAEEGLRRLGHSQRNRAQAGFSTGLAVVLNSEDHRTNLPKTHLISSSDDLGSGSIDRALEHVFDLPHKSLHSHKSSINTDFIHSILKRESQRFQLQSSSPSLTREGIIIFDSGHGTETVVIDEASTCGDIRVFKQPLLIESQAVFSSARANACVWKGKWMYEVVLETSGVQQLGWATVSCPFTDHKGVGDAEDSYAFDGRRISKWNKEHHSYGQSWVVGDVIGCCIDLDQDQISFFRNGVSLGVAFDGIRKMEAGFGYYPAVSLSQGERCDLNFGARPFKYPIEGFHPIQYMPTFSDGDKKAFAPDVASYLLQCISRLIRLQSVDLSASSSVDNLRRLKRIAPLEELFGLISLGICQEFFSLVELMSGNVEYICWGPLVSFLFDIFGVKAPHDYASLDMVLDLFLGFNGFETLVEHVIHALGTGCKTAPLVLTDCPFTGSYPYLALACYILRREEMIIQWWKSTDFEFLLEGLLSRMVPNKQDLQYLMPTVWWPGSCETMTSVSHMVQITEALSGAVGKIEEMHRELCRLVIQFVPPVSPPQLTGSVFRTFLQNLIWKNRGADRNVPPPGLSSNSVLVSMYTVILHFLSEGFGMGDVSGWMKGFVNSKGFLHRGGQQSFPVSLFLKADPHRVDFSRLGGSYNHLSKCHPVIDGEVEVVQWEEGCMDDEKTRITHSTKQKPCCCSSSDFEFTKSTHPVRIITRGSRGHCSSIPERSSQVTAECSASGLSEEIVANKPSSSDRPEPDFGYRPIHQLRSVPKSSLLSSGTLQEEELLDAMLLLYYLGLSPNFKQASYYMSHQSQSISLLDETDKQIRSERTCAEHLKRLKEARNVYREDLIDCVRQCAWYRIYLFSRWKQRGMYAACMWIVHLLLVLSKMDSVFIYIPEFYLVALVDCFHALRRSDPPFVSSSIFLQHGLSSFVTFVVTHFNDSRISSADLKDVLLQSITVLVQYKDFLIAFESNEAAVERMPSALLSSFDNRFWIPVTTILLRLCIGSGFGTPKPAESSSIHFQGLLQKVCLQDEELFCTFLNRLFNNLSWTITEFSVSIREMQESYQVQEMQQRKCTVIYDLSCSLARVLEFFTREIPRAFLFGPVTNLRRLTELIIFILNRMTSAADVEFFEMCIRRQHQSIEKVNRAMMLAPLVGMISNLVDASGDPSQVVENDVVEVFASMDCSAALHFGFQYLLDYNWGAVSRAGVSLARLRQLERFTFCLRIRAEREGRSVTNEICDERENEESCCICYSCDADAEFVPCNHRSCIGCITRHLLNNRKCFFCNREVLEVVSKVGSSEKRS